MQLDVKALGAEIGALIASTVAPLQRELADLRAKLVELESRPPEKGERGDRGERGADAPPATDEQIFSQVAKYLRENPARGERGEPGEKGDPGENGKDAEPIDISAVIRELIESDELLSLVELRVKEAVAEIPAPKDGEKGERGERGEKGDKGDAGKDADPVDTKAVVRDLLASDDLLSLVELRVKEAVAEIPAPKDGEKGERGERGEKGEDGKDGAGIQDLLIDRDGNLVATMTDGRTKSLGLVIGKDGAPGRDGKDGADFSDVTFEYDGERMLTIRGKGGEIKKRLPIPIDRGYWKKGAFEQADIVTEGGTAYIALKDTSEKPSPSSADWRILARKGRDGADGRNGIDKTAPVKL